MEKTVPKTATERREDAIASSNEPFPPTTNVVDDDQCLQYVEYCQRGTVAPDH